ncbi:peptidylprolyl isomerase [Nitrococcus mobilis]|uniref:Peptidyl-prolyl cis-trans isomerase C n=1 Tax=Nitrococcus mobilis Nb-231 TaxID=314278 RepID=A4BUM0_9GAMM|nr:peptidylprolyl isomerase [Nitrococcus mobilis]EAR20586.1 peptidyl-prolyl cis-trans isomerase C [Nitrococcus mobilis Nb-231]
MAKARARHILVPEEQQCLELKERIDNGEDFAAIAREHSKCPSGQKGGDLGEFTQGQMVPEFDKVVFNDELNKVHGPVRTQFGYHLLEVLERTD